MLSKNIYSRVLNVVIAICVALTSPEVTLAADSYAHSKSSISRKDRAQAHLREYSDALFSDNPLLEAFLRSELPEGHGSGFHHSEVLVDENPFFIRGQKWTQLSDEEKSVHSMDSGVFSQVVGDTTQLALVEAGLKLELPLPLHAILDGSEFLIFTLSTRSNLFSSLSDSDEPSEGFFYISKSELYAMAATVNQGAPLQFAGVPVNYFALPESGWQGALEAFEWTAIDSVILFNKNDAIPLPIALNDIRDHYKHAKMNYVLSKLVNLVGKWNELESVQLVDILGALPARGATAGLGTFLTGFDLDNSKGNMWSALSKDNSERSRFLAKLKEVLISKAEAAETDSAASNGNGNGSNVLNGNGKNKVVKHLETAAMVGITGWMAYLSADYISVIDDKDLERIYFLAKIIGGSFFASIALKYSIFRDKFKEKYRVGETPAEQRPGFQGVMSRGVKRSQNELKGIFDVFAHVLTALSKTIPLSAVNLLEFLGDRFATKKMGPQNALMRKGFMKTFGFMRRTMENLAVNWKTWFLGAIIMGITVDAMLVAVQLVIVAPALAVWSGMQTEAEAYQFKTDPTSTVNGFVTAEVMRNVVDYIRGGADSYSHEQRVLVTDRVTHLVDKEMSRSGLDPRAKENEKERNKRIEVKMEIAMKLRGLPGSEEFLFDAMTISRKLTRSMGYSTAELVEDLETKDNFLLEYGRWGLAKPSLDKAIKVAKKIEKSHSSRIGLQAIELLKEFQKRWSYIWGVAKSPLSVVSDRNYVKEARQVRQVLTLLSFGGDVKTVVQFLPEWVKDLGYSEEVLLVAARLYSGALYSIIEGDEEFLEVSSDKTIKIYEMVGSVDLLSNTDRLRAVGAIRGQPESGDKLVSTVQALQDEKTGDIFHDYLVQQRSLKVVNEAVKKRSQVESYVPPKPSWFERWQKSRAQSAAAVELSIYRSSQAEAESSASPEKEQEFYKRIYAKKLGQIVGLKLQENSNFFKQVEAEAEEATSTQLSRIEERNYLESLTDEQKSVYIAEVYGSNFLTMYNKMAVMTDEYLEATSEEQPGMFQGLRKKLASYINKKTEMRESEGVWSKVQSKVALGASKFTNAALRVSEAMWSTHSNEPGLINWIDRNVPFAHDMWHNFARSLKTMPYFLSLGYLAYYYIWQVQIAYPMWFMVIGAGFTGLMFVEFNNRMMQNMGIKPMEGIKQKWYYSWLHSWLTFPVFLPLMIYGESFSKAWYEHLWNPIVNASNTAIDAAKGALGVARDFVIGKASAADVISSVNPETVASAVSVVDTVSACSKALMP